MRRVCKSDIVSLTHAATCARLMISRCVLEDNEELSCDKHYCCYEDNSPGHFSLSRTPQTLSKWALSALSAIKKLFFINLHKN